MPFELTARPFKKADLPTTQAEIVKEAKELIDQICVSWKKGKCYHNTLGLNPTLDSDKVAVQTYYTNREKEYWLSRVSEHHLDAATYERLVKVLNGSVKEGSHWELPDRTARSRIEIDYIETLTHVEVLETTDSGWVAVNLEYELGKPLTTREFNEWVYVVPPFKSSDNDIETSIVVSLVADAPLNDPVAHTHATYASVETLEYNLKTEQLTWKMALTSDAGGNVPKWVQNSMIAKTVAKDVSYMLEWLGDHKDSK
ncbi:LANO_0G11078g1_1 [Lachancea nothofagi CBS 11611]|uniref:LANO_0G11078g1_1 n=1 Tax=Lachancea nothofagi CBS 11611 TaxID=1266666 RepID=A0A1G4KJA9_9SACH|nr:LANO_0G11078g1_1 [Lachancea nothofagi CBS 11611]